MSLSIETERITEDLPDLDAILDAILDDPRLRPLGIAGGATALFLAVLLQVQPVNEFWSAVLGGVLAFVGVPLLAVGLAAPEPDDESSRFHLGVGLTTTQRRVVVTGSLLVLVSPMIVAAIGPFVGFASWVWLSAAAVAFVGAVLILTGFVAWTSGAIAEPSNT